MQDNDTAHKILKASELIRSTEYCIALTGAGISTPSGIPDFRTPGNGLWEKDDPFEVASLTSFRYKPERFYNWLRPMALKFKEAEPNPAHIALADLEKMGILKTLITQNIDGLHQKAGTQRILEVHGSMRSMTCTHCFRKYEAEQFLDDFISNGKIPLCSDCGHVLKPDVILMEEQLPIETWMDAQREAEQCSIMIVVGSSLEVVPVAGLPYKALSNNGELILINITSTYVDTRAEVVIHEDASLVLPQIVDHLK